MGRAFPERSECPEVPDNIAIGGLDLLNPSEPLDRIIQSQFFTFPPPEPPSFDFGCYGPSVEASLAESSSAVFDVSVEYPDENETGKCAPTFKFNVGIPPCVTASAEASVNVSSELSKPNVTFTTKRASNNPCAYNFRFNMNLPGFCPTVRTEASIAVDPLLSVPTIVFTGDRDVAEPCRFKFRVNIKLPESTGQDDVCQARMATIGDVLLTGIQTIDGVSGIDDDIVLVKDQTSGSQNGAYFMRSGVWERACDLSRAGIIVTVREGGTNANTAWLLSTNNPITVGVTPLTFTLISGAACCCYARAATLEDITLSGTQTIDGIALSKGDIVLVKNQTDAKQNGPYIVNSGVSPAWERTCELAAGMTVSVREGNTHARQIWILVTNDPIVVDTTPLSFDIVRAPGNTTVRACADIKIALSGLQTIDGISLGANNRCLVTAQSTASQNGIYIVQSGAWVRAQADAAIVEGMLVSVREGTTLKSVVFMLLTPAPIVVDVTALTFSPATSNTIYSVKATTTSNITLSGAQTIDGISCPVGSVVLVRKQSTPSENGVYRVASGTWKKLSLNTEGLMAVCREGVTYRRLAFFLESDTTTWTGLSAFLQV